MRHSKPKRKTKREIKPLLKPENLLFFETERVLQLTENGVAVLTGIWRETFAL